MEFLGMSGWSIAAYKAASYVYDDTMSACTTQIPPIFFSLRMLDQ